MINSLFYSLWQYRGFILNSIKRDFQTRYKKSLLGILWSVIHPLVSIIIYTGIFSHIMRQHLPADDSALSYSIYLCAGILPWGLFTEVVTRSQNMFIDNGNLLKKSSFPKLCLPTIIVSSAMINFAIIFSLFIMFLLILGRWPGASFFAVFPVLLIQLLFSISLGILIGTLNVFFRDVGHIMNIGLQFWYWITPIVYVENIIPTSLGPWLHINPMFPVISAYHSIFLNKTMPHWTSLISTITISAAILLLTILLFKNKSAELVDEL